MDNNLSKLIEIWRLNQPPNVNFENDLNNHDIEFEGLGWVVTGDVNWNKESQCYFFYINRVRNSINYTEIEVNDDNLSVIEYLAILSKLQDEYGLDFFEFSKFNPPNNVIELFKK